MQALDILASETVFVGDELDHDVEGAQKVGMRTILLKRPSTKETPRRVKPEAIIDEIKELPQALENLETEDKQIKIEDTRATSKPVKEFEE